MNRTYRAIAILGITSVIGSLAPAVQAQSPQTAVVEANAVTLINEGLEKAKRRDYQGAIADYTLALGSAAVSKVRDIATRER